jgi:hypothetical protein
MILRRLVIAATVVVGVFVNSACATKRPLVDGFFERDGVIYRSSESEAWGSRGTLNIRGMEF